REAAADGPWGPGGEAWRSRDWREAPWHNERWRRGAQRWFLRAVLFFTVSVVALVGGLALLIYLVVRLAGGETQTAVALWMGTLLLMVLLPVGAAWLGRRLWQGFAQPMAALMRAAEAVGQGDLRVRVPEAGRGDLLRLERTFNTMVAELERAETRRRSITADVAHELRTPLQILQGNLEGVIDGVFEPTPAFVNDLLDETRLLTRLVEDLRLLSQAEDGRLALEWERVDLVDLARDAVTGWQPHATDRSVVLHVEAEALTLFVRADWMRLTQVLNNLLSNALRHVPEGGDVSVTVTRRAAEEGGPAMARLAVANSGAPIPEETLPYLFDRFWRGDKARTRTTATNTAAAIVASTA
ncbi:MAG: sensor histidine kinase, partial [Caldilineaceae bacterium]